MRIILCSLLILALLFSVTACSSSKEIKGVSHEPYGLLNSDTKYDPNVIYEANFSDVVLGIVFVETIFMPVYIFGYDVMEPVAEKPAEKPTN